MDDFLQHLLVQAQVGDHALEAGVLLFQLLQAAQLADAQAAVFLLPVVGGGFGNTHLAADLGDGGAGLRLAQREGNLFFGELRFFHDKSPARMGLNLLEISTFAATFLREEVTRPECAPARCWGEEGFASRFRDAVYKYSIDSGLPVS